MVFLNILFILHIPDTWQAASCFGKVTPMNYSYGCVLGLSWPGSGLHGVEFCLCFTDNCCSAVNILQTGATPRITPRPTDNRTDKLKGGSDKHLLLSIFKYLHNMWLSDVCLLATASFHNFHVIKENNFSDYKLVRYHNDLPVSPDEIFLNFCCRLQQMMIFPVGLPVSTLLRKSLSAFSRN